MRIRDLPFKDARAHAWSSRSESSFNGKDVPVRIIRHYETDMLAICLDDDGSIEPMCSGHVLSLGHGSVSDQNGCNQVFRAIGSPLYYSRRGGADVS